MMKNTMEIMRTKKILAISAPAQSTPQSEIVSQNVQGLLESKDAHRPKEGPMLLRIDLP